MVNLGLFRRQQQQLEPQDLKQKVGKRGFRMSRTSSVGTEQTDDSERSGDDSSFLVVTARTEKNGLPSRSTRKSGSRLHKTKHVRFAPAEHNVVHEHYSHHDEDITRSEIWWLPQELNDCLQSDFKALVPPELVKTKTFPAEVQDLGLVISSFYNTATVPSLSEKEWTSRLHAVMDRLQDWRGLEDGMGMHCHHDLRDDHILAVLRAVGGGSQKRGPRRSLRRGNRPIAVNPPNTSRVAATLAHMRAKHDELHA